jgi:hypothetical protein
LYTGRKIDHDRAALTLMVLLAAFGAEAGWLGLC